MKKRIIVKRPMHSAELVETEIKYRCNLKEYISNDRRVLLEHVPVLTNSGLYAVVDEEGIPKNLDNNMFVSVPSNVHPIQLLFGNVVFCRLSFNVNDDYDYQVEDLTDDDIATVSTLIHTQRYLSSQFKKLYSSFEEYKRPKVFTFEGGEQINGNY